MFPRNVHYRVISCLEIPFKTSSGHIHYISFVADTKIQNLNDFHQDSEKFSAISNFSQFSVVMPIFDPISGDNNYRF